MTSSNPNPAEAQPDSGLVPPTETVLWTGSPPTRIRLHWGDIGVLGFFLIAIAMFLTRVVGIPVEVVRIQAPFGGVIGVCAVWLFVRLVIDPWMRRRTSYVLTEDWFRIETRVFGRRERRIWIGAVRDVIVWRNPDDSGMLVLSTPPVESGLKKYYFQRRLLHAQLWGQDHVGADEEDVAAIEVANRLRQLAELVRARIRVAKENDARWTS